MASDILLPSIICNQQLGGKTWIVPSVNKFSFCSLRQLTTDRIGTLIEISGTVTRSSAVWQLKCLHAREVYAAFRFVPSLSRAHLRVWTADKKSQTFSSSLCMPHFLSYPSFPIC